MKKALFYLCGVVILTFLSRDVRADEISELKTQLKLLQTQMQEQMMQLEQQARQIKEQKKHIELMQERVATLEVERAAKVKAPGKRDETGGLLSLRGEKWQLGGELEFEFVDTQKHAAVDEPEAHFQLDKFMLIPKVSFTDDIYLYGEIEFYRTSSEVKKVFAHFDNLPSNSFLRLGIDERFMKPSRKTERYPLVGNAFWRDSAAGIFAGGMLKPLYWHFSYSSGFAVAQRAITEDNSLAMIHDHRKTSDYSSPGELGWGLGFEYDFEKLGKFDALGFFYLSKMSAADETTLRTDVTGYDSDERDQYRYGLNLNYVLGNASLFTHFIQARDGDLDRFSWYIQPSYKIKLGERKFFYAVEPLFRYGALSLNIDEAVDDSLTWDREEFTFALITDIYKNIKLKTEYTIDQMDKGIGGTKNYGEFLAQLEVKF